MDKFKHFVGIDISKSSFDVAVLTPFNLEAKIHQVFPNSVKGIKKFIKWINNERLSIDNTLFCLEQTGIYSELLSSHLEDVEAKVWVIMPYAMKHSMGLQRGKTDKLDSFRIAEYGFRHEDKVVLEKASNQGIKTLKKMLTAREQLLDSISRLQVYLAELKQFDPDSYRIIKSSYTSSINSLKKNLKKLEEEIDKVCLKNEEIRKTLSLGCSIVGVGKITILHIMVATKMFTKCVNAKQLACYCGVAPFAFSSGKSINKKPRVHFMANKKIKSLLHMCAISSIRHDQEINAYYTRKIEEGKHALVCINNVKRKLLERIFVVIKRQTPYMKVAA
ncbi:MAG: IS110 family transposase [Chitinophagales bacterium]